MAAGPAGSDEPGGAGPPLLPARLGDGPAPRYDRAVMHDRRRLLHTMNDTFWVLALALIVLFAFFVALGAFKPGEVVGLTLAVAALAVLWVGHAMWVSRHAQGRDPASVRNRERRGF